MKKFFLLQFVIAALIQFGYPQLSTEAIYTLKSSEKLIAWDKSSAIPLKNKPGYIFFVERVGKIYARIQGDKELGPLNSTIEKLSVQVIGDFVNLTKDTLIVPFSGVYFAKSDGFFLEISEKTFGPYSKISNVNTTGNDVVFQYSRAGSSYYYYNNKSFRADSIKTTHDGSNVIVSYLNTADKRYYVNINGVLHGPLNSSPQLYKGCIVYENTNTLERFLTPEEQKIQKQSQLAGKQITNEIGKQVGINIGKIERDVKKTSVSKTTSGYYLRYRNAEDGPFVSAQLKEIDIEGRKELLNEFLEKDGSVFSFDLQRQKMVSLDAYIRSKEEEKKEIKAGKLYQDDQDGKYYVQLDKEKKEIKYAPERFLGATFRQGKWDLVYKTEDNSGIEWVSDDSEKPNPLEIQNPKVIFSQDNKYWLVGNEEKTIINGQIFLDGGIGFVFNKEKKGFEWLSVKDNAVFYNIFR